MRATFLCVLIAAAGIACGGNTPTQPRIPEAVLVQTGTFSFPICLAGLCTYQGEARNSGNGCAANVRGVTRLLAASGAQVATDDWALDTSVRIRPSELFIYRDCCIAQSVASQQGNTYRTTFSWDNVRC